MGFNRLQGVSQNTVPTAAAEVFENPPPSEGFRLFRLLGLGCLGQVLQAQDTGLYLVDGRARVLAVLIAVSPVPQRSGFIQHGYFHLGCSPCRVD